MRKEVVFAIITGAALGLIVAFGVWRANGALKTMALTNVFPSSSPRALQTPSVMAQTQTSGQLTLLSPLSEEVIVGDSVTVSGATKANSWIVIVADGKTTLTQSDPTGSFSQAITLPVGLTMINVTAFEKTGTMSETRVTVAMTTALPQPTTSTPAPQSSDSVRSKVQEKLEQATNKPTAYIGTVTDKTDTGLQIKSIQGEIKQATVASINEVVRLGKPNKTLSFADVAIGDYIAAIGYKNGNTVLDMKRIYITSAPSASGKSVYGTVARLTKSELDIKALASSDITTVKSGLSVYLVGEAAKLTTKKLSDIAMGDTLIKTDTAILITATIATPKPTSTAKPSVKPSATP